ncbi:cell division control protein [Malassezia restricta]|uniref:Putative HIT-like protein n=1 Tax=Malassezia restricta (strain ATCC 96810 / NBRC 103918 / CBS 7877) TaxID=425264 RepID=A0A3G2RZ39_MALR7|nr:cell division control protein [Malassezia restricta]AXA48749.1 cell division control protein [Malassezia restricta]AYO41051.1 putative HIT-like protein [Malassezia restricta CBS 7877]
MTSPFLDRVNQHDKWYKADDCVFCDIIAGNTGAYVVAETDMYMAFLDILPIRAGHTLVIPKAHVSHISDMSEEQSAALMHGIVRVTRAMKKAFDATGLQVAANQEYAQVVNHVHFHIVPAISDSTSILSKWNKPPKVSIPGRRDELDEQEAVELQARLQRHMHGPKL